METAILTGATLIGKGVLSKLIPELYDIIKNNTSSEFARAMKTVDIQSDVEIIEALLGDIEKHEKKDCNVVNVCVKHIHKHLEDIKMEIENMNIKLINQHYSKYYLSGWRNPNYQENLDNIKTIQDKLNKRVDILIKILNLD